MASWRPLQVQTGPNCDPELQTGHPIWLHSTAGSGLDRPQPESARLPGRIASQLGLTGQLLDLRKEVFPVQSARGFHEVPDGGGLPASVLSLSPVRIVVSLLSAFLCCSKKVGRRSSPHRSDRGVTAI